MSSPSPASSPLGPIEARDNPPEIPDDGSALGDDSSSLTASLASSILQYRTMNGRTYHSERGKGNYWGTNDERQNNLLDIQHHVFTLVLSDALYLAPLPDNLHKVLDVGTGTGAWAIDFADEHPESQVIGTDLSPIQPTWVPPNVQFQIDDFTEPWTFSEGSFDYVHSRWLNGSVPDWTAFFRQGYRVLKPGGWIESYDVNGFFESDDDTLTDTTAVSQINHVVTEGGKKLKLPVFSTVRDNLQQKGLEAAGFVNLEEKLFKVPCCEWPKDPKLSEIGLYARAVYETDMEGVLALVANAIGWTPEEVTVLAAKLRRELRSLKIHAYYHARVVYAQKPEA